MENEICGIQDKAIVENTEIKRTRNPIIEREKSMDNILTKVKIELGIPVRMTGKEFITLNRKIFEKNNNLEEQTKFLKVNDCYTEEANLVLTGGCVGILDLQ